MSIIENYFNIKASFSPQWLGEDTMAFLSDESGVNQIWKMKMGSEAEQRTFFQERVLKFAIGPNNKDIFFTMDVGGNEKEQIYLLRDGEREAVNLTNNPNSLHSFGGIRPDGKTMVYSSTERNAANYDIWKMDITSGKKEMIVENNDNYNIPARLSPNGSYLLYNKSKGHSDDHIWMVNIGTKEVEKIHEEGEFARYRNPRWTKDSKGFYLLTNVNSDFVYLAHYDVESKELKKIYEEEWDLESIDLSFDDKYLGMTINRHGFSAMEILNTKTGKLESIAEIPEGVIASDIEWSKKSNRLLFSLTSGDSPNNIWMLDFENKSLIKVTESNIVGINEVDLIKPSLHHYTSFDGLEISFWFYKTNKTTEDAPLIIDIHGGPVGQKRPSFNAVTQYLLSQGFSIVGPNVRGSSGYGKQYTHLDDFEKRMDSVKDIKSLVEYLLEEAFVKKDKIIAMGGSYGGFMTLAALTEYPNLWAAGIDRVGISNFETFLENTSDYRRSHRESEYGSLESDRELLRSISPIHKVEKITAPLMVIHGANDPRVPVSEAEQIVSKLKEYNIPVEYLLYEDEGHGLSKRKNQVDCYPKVAGFLKKHVK